MRNQLSHIRGVLYTLKRDYGFPFDIYKRMDSQTDFATGQKVTTNVKYHIRKAIVLPTVMTRKYATILYREQKDFKFGGLFDISLRAVILDRRDLPKNFELTLDDYAVYQEHRYELKNVDELEHRQGYFLLIQETIRTLPKEVLTVNVTHSLELVQNVSTT
jgi:hypothetical protein